MSPNVRKFNNGQEQYIAWLAIPRFERIPGTQAEFAKSIGVTDRTLRRWHDLPGFWDEVTAVSRQNLREGIGNIYGALRRAAESGSFQHIKLALELLGEHIDRLQVQTWQDEIIQLLREGKVKPEDVAAEFPELADEFFARAGVSAK
jgi:hypothetical protein